MTAALTAPPAAPAGAAAVPPSVPALLAARWRALPPAARAALAVVAAAAGCELLFGWSRGADVAGLRLPTGIPLGNLVEGAVGGLLYGLVALGVVLVHRASRVVNFAQAALGGTPALLGLLLVGDAHVPYLVGVLVTLVAAVVVGVVAERVVLKPFMTGSRLILTVATIGLGQFLAVGELLLPRAFGQSSVVVPAIRTPLDGLHVSVTGVRLNGNYLAVVVVSVALLAGLGVFFRTSRLGLAVRASADNADRARLLGIPVATVTTVVWVMATLLSAVAAFLRQPLVGSSLGADIDVSVLLFGLAAAVVARFDALPTAVLAGVGLGMLDRAAYYGTGNPKLPVACVLPVLLVSLLARRQRASRAFDTGISSFAVASEPRRVPLALRAHPEVRVVGWAGRLALLAVVLVAPLALGPVNSGKLAGIALTATVAVSLVVLTGWAGQVSLGQYGVAGLGAAVAGGLAVHVHADFFLTLVAAVVVGAAVSALIGLPALRLPGLLLAVVTLAFAAFVQVVVLDRHYLPWLLPGDQDTVGRPVLFGRWDTSGDVAFTYVCLAGLALALLSAVSLRRSRSGRVLLSQRDNVRASQAVGVNALRSRLVAFAVAGGIAALAGALTAYQQGTVNADQYPVTLSVLVFTSAVIGGIGSPGGAVTGALLAGFLQYQGGTLFEPFRWVGLGAVADNAQSFGVATGVLFVLGFFPGGVASAAEQLRDRWLRRIATRDCIRVPSLVADTLKPSASPTHAAAAGPAADGVALGELAEAQDAADEAPPERWVDDPVDPLLVVRDLRVAYDGVKVLFGVDLHVRRGEVLALLGTNGAGKSTALKAISGLVASTGSVELDGRDLSRADARERVRAGIVMVPGGKGVFPTVTVADHFRAARWLADGRDEGGSGDPADAVDTVDARPAGAGARLVPAAARAVGPARRRPVRRRAAAARRGHGLPRPARAARHRRAVPRPLARRRRAAARRRARDQRRGHLGRARRAERQRRAHRRRPRLLPGEGRGAVRRADGRPARAR